jgi:uncharacterized membrane protein
MIAIGMTLLAIGGIGSLICWIMVLIKMFQNEKPLIGILGILCSLWAFIWGWTKASTLGLKKTMLIWSGCIVLTVVAQVITGMGAARVESGGYEVVQPQ